MTELRAINATVPGSTVPISSAHETASVNGLGRMLAVQQQHPIMARPPFACDPVRFNPHSYKELVTPGR